MCCKHLCKLPTNTVNFSLVSTSLTLLGSFRGRRLDQAGLLGNFCNPELQSWPKTVERKYISKLLCAVSQTFGQDCGSLRAVSTGEGKLRKVFCMQAMIVAELIWVEIFSAAIELLICSIPKFLNIPSPGIQP